MSRMSKTLLKLISIVLAVYLVVAAIPVFQHTYQGIAMPPNPSPTPLGPTSTLKESSLIFQGPTSAPQGFTSTPKQPSITPAKVTSTPGVLTSTPDKPTFTPKIPTSTPVTPTATPVEPTATQVVAESNPTSIVNAYPALPYSIHLPVISVSIPYPYQIQPGTPTLIQNFAHAYAACSWLSVAGQVIDSSGTPVKNLVVSIKGTLNGNLVDLLGLTGLADEYGPGGYEIQLGTQPVASTGTLTIQVLDLDGNALTAAILFDTTAECSQNVILINFTP